MLKQLQTACVLMLLASMSLSPMEKEAADVDEFAQAKKFHERLQYAYHGILQDDTQSYYKKIDPITSTPMHLVKNMGYTCNVYIEDQYVFTYGKGFYKYKNISLTIEPAADFDPTKPFDILVTHNETSSNVQFSRSYERKIPSCSHFDSYSYTLNKIHNNHLSLKQYITFKGVLHIPKGNPCVIFIEFENNCREPITLRGMEIVCCKDEKTTKIFFDFTDNANKAAEDFDNPMECKHSIAADKNYYFFDSLEMRNKWVPDESNFYDLDNQILAPLPHCYSNIDDHQETSNETTDWFFDGTNDSLYQVPDEIWKLIFLAQNKYSTIWPNMYPERKAATMWCAMKKLVNTSLVCKRFNAVTRKLLPSYTKAIKKYIDQLGGKNEAICTAFSRLNSLYRNYYWFKVTEICMAMKANLNITKYVSGSDTLLNQAIRNSNIHQIEHLIKKGADPKKHNYKGDMPIDLAYANGLLEAARLIKDNGGDPEDKYEYKNGNFVCKQGQGGQAYAPQQANRINAANNNPPPIPPQTFSLASWITKSPSYLFLAGISAGAVAYWLYTKYRAVDESEEEESDCVEADIENEEECIAQPSSSYI